MNQTNDLEKLAEVCLASAKTVKDYLSKNGHPLPTFDQDGPSTYPPMSPEVELARMELRAASQALNELACSPDDVGQRVADMLHDINAFRYVWKFKIAFAVPHNEVVSYKEVAANTGTEEKQMRKFVRQLIQTHVFCEPKPGHVAHTAASRLLTQTGIEAWIGYNTNDNLPLVHKQVEAIERWGHNAQEVNHCPGNIVYGNDLPVYQTYAQTPELLKRFSDLMFYVSSFEVFDNIHVVTGYDWNSLGAGTVVDIGGNMGHCCINIANANSDLKFIVQDLENVVARAQDPKTNVIPADLKNRISFMPHNFLDTQPIVGADVYFLRMILHDYSDMYAIKILRAIVPALRTGSRIIIMDQIMPPVGAVHPVFERVARSMQLTMQMLSNGVEREYEEWQEVFFKVDPRLKIKSTNRPTGSLMYVIEVVLEENTENGAHDHGTNEHKSDTTATSDENVNGTSHLAPVA